MAASAEKGLDRMVTAVDEQQHLADNRLLAALPCEERTHLVSLLRTVHLRQRQLVQLSGEPVGMVYFPISAVLSLVSTLQDGSNTELGTIGSEGMAGLPALLHASAQPFEIVVQIPGTAYWMPAGALCHEAGASAALQDLLLRYAQVFFDSVAQGAACHSHHSLRQRLARMLLEMDDAVGCNGLRMTHEFLSQRLGVGRPSVSLAAAALRESRLIHYSRGTIAITNRAGLLAESCECYQRIRREYHRLLD